MAGPGPRHADHRGLVLPTGALAVSIVAVALAAVGYVLTSHPGRVHDSGDTPTATHALVTPSPTPSPTVTPTKHARPTLRRTAYAVVVFNNSNVAGLTGRTAKRAEAVGWNVVGEDNWYGTISAPTVYYPDGMHRAAKTLGKDLGISRVMPAISPMSNQRLTVILTADYSG